MKPGFIYYPVIACCACPRHAFSLFQTPTPLKHWAKTRSSARALIKMSALDSLSDTPPRRIVETQYTLSDDDTSSRPSRNYQHHHRYHHRHDDYDDEGGDGDDYNYGYGYDYCDRHADNGADDISLISAPTKKRVRGIDPNNGRCLVENCIEHAGVIYCYCFPIYVSDTDPDLVCLLWTSTNFSLTPVCHQARQYRVVLEHPILYVEPSE